MGFTRWGFWTDRPHALLSPLQITHPTIHVFGKNDEYYFYGRRCNARLLHFRVRINPKSPAPKQVPKFRLYGAAGCRPQIS